MAKEICSLLRECGCRSVHIGGGEPFLNIEGLVFLLKTAQQSGITVEYIETNAFWAEDESLAKEYLHAIMFAYADMQAGSYAYAAIPALCISLDPFHAEYVPAALPIKLTEICRDEGFEYFLWQGKYRRLLSQLQTPHKAQTRTELEQQLSPNYVLETAESYGLKIGGRALTIETEYGIPKLLADIKSASSVTRKPHCRNLLSSNHFHVDLHGQYIPPGCTGIVIPLAEAINGVPRGKYPAFDALVTGGVAALLELAYGLGFKPDATYTSSCALCINIRHWLSTQPGFPELDVEHYVASLSHT